MSSNKKAPMPISAEQSKLLESALRIKILNVLANEAHTSKQVANLLGKTPATCIITSRSCTTAGCWI